MKPEMDTYSYLPTGPGSVPRGDSSQSTSLMSPMSMQRTLSVDTSKSSITVDSGYASFGMYEESQQSNEYSPYNVEGLSSDGKTFYPGSQSYSSQNDQSFGQGGYSYGQGGESYSHDSQSYDQDGQVYGTSDYILKSAGQWTEQNTPKTAVPMVLETPMQLFARIIGDVGRTSNQITERASKHRPAQVKWITPDLIQREEVPLHIARGSSGPSAETTREAIQNVLFQHLWTLFKSEDANVMVDIAPNSYEALVEAAWQLQKELDRTGASGVPEICVCAIGMVLTHLQRELQTADSTWAPSYGEAADHNLVFPGDSAWPLDAQAQSPLEQVDWTLDGESSLPMKGEIDPVAGGPTQARPSPEGDKYFICDVASCRRPFRRPADLLRHKDMLHKPQKDKKPLYCDYKKCARHQNPFYRLDHLREHLRLYHKEDLVPRGGKGDAVFWESRSHKAMFRGWYRCNRCLDRVSIAEHAFVCPGCQTHLEPDRQAARGYQEQRR